MYHTSEVERRVSAKTIQKYAQDNNITVLDALSQLDRLAGDDWAYTLPGAPKNHQTKTTELQRSALSTFAQNRKLWIKTAQELGLDLQGFTLEFYNQ